MQDTSDIFFYVGVAFVVSLMLLTLPDFLIRRKILNRWDGKLGCLALFQFLCAGGLLVAIHYVSTLFNSMRLERDEIHLGRAFPLSSIRLHRQEIRWIEWIDSEEKETIPPYFSLALKDGRKFVQSGNWKDPNLAKKQLGEWWGAKFITSTQPEAKDSSPPSLEGRL